MMLSLLLVYLSTAACISEKRVYVSARSFQDQRSSTNHKMLLFVSWSSKYATIEWPLFDAPTNTHGVFTPFSLPQYCCLHFWKKNKVGSTLAQGFLRFKGHAKITKFCFLWVGAINTQSLSGHYLLRQEIPMVLVLLLVYIGAVAYISIAISFGSFWRGII